MNKTLIIVLVALLATFLFACAQTKSIAVVHPEKVSGLPDCGECHSDGYALLNHRNNSFFGNHRVYAMQQRNACAMCHDQAFCSDCHAHKEEITPADKYKGSVQRALPHRGDYLTRHRIEGKINPASCLKCHGSQNNERCLTCHK